jgi:hypothetical protein
MIGKHVDLIAIGVLLCGIALYSAARDSMVVTVTPQKRIILSSPRCRPPAVAVPEIPRFPYARD